MLFDGAGDIFRRQAQLVEEQAGNAVCIENETEQDMFGPDVIMVEIFCAASCAYCRTALASLVRRLFIMGNSLPPVSCEYGLDGLGPLVLELFIIQFRPGLEL